MSNDILRSGGNGRRSTCVIHNDVLYTSGITTVDLEADITGQANDIFTQLDRLMAYRNTDKNHILSATIYLKSMEDFGAFNAAWDLWVMDGYEPARSVVEANLALEEYLLKVSLIVAIP